MDYFYTRVHHFLGEPNDSNNEDCLQMRYVTAELNDDKCGGKADGYACETVKRAYMNQ